MGYQSLDFNGMSLLAYVDEDTDYKLKEKDIIFCMQLNLYFEVTNKKFDVMKLRKDGYKKIQNTLLKHAGISKFKSEDEELYLEKKSHLLLIPVEL